MAAKGASALGLLRWVTFSLAACLLGFWIASAQPHARQQETFTALFRAIDNNDTNAVQDLLTHNKDLVDDAYYDIYYSKHHPLLQAAADGRIEIVALLLKHGANPNAWGDIRNSANAQMTALEEAVSYGHEEVCKLLLEAGANPNHRSFSQNSALHFALEGFIPPDIQERIACLLLDYGADPFLEAGYYRRTPFELAIIRSDGKLVPRMLKQSRAAPGGPTRGAELLAREGPPPLNKEAAQFLANHGAAMLEATVQRGQLEAAEALLAAGVSPNVQSPQRLTLFQTLALAVAAARDSKDFAPERWAKLRDLLRRNGCDYDVFVATGFGDLETARELWTANGNVVLARDGESQTLLHWSVRTDRLPLTDFWLKVGVSPAATNLAGQTALHLAAARGLANQVTRLLAAHAPTNVRDSNGWTPLDTAIQAKQSETIRLLLGAGTAGSRPERGVSTPLHLAAAKGDIVALSALVDSANLDARNELGFTPLQLAVQHGHLGAAAFLLDKGADVNARDPEGNTALHLILLHRPVVIQSRPPATWLARMKSDPRKEPYVRYLTTKDEESMEWPVPNAAAFLLAAGVDAAATNQSGKTVAALATDDSIMLFDEERAALLRLLGAVGANLNARDANGDTALHRAALGIYKDKVAELIATGADVNATNRQGRTPLHAAVEKIGVWEGPLVEILKAKPRVNARDNEGLTPLHVVALSDSTFRREATKALLEAGADPNARDKHGRTPLHLFLTGEWPWGEAGDCIVQLVAFGADAGLADNQGRTWLHYLAALGEQGPIFFIRDVTNSLSSPKVDVNLADRDGNTALHLAAKSGSVDVFDWLVARGARLDVTNHAGETPRLLALHTTNLAARIRFKAHADIFPAARDGKLETVAALLKAEPRLLDETNLAGQTPLRLAVLGRHTNLVEFLVGQGARWDMATAVMAGRAEVVRDLLSRQPGSITNSLHGDTLLHLAAANDSRATAKLLISAGARVDAQNWAGLSPLGMALQRPRSAVANLLLNHGAAENIFDAVCLDHFDKAAALLAANKSLVGATNPAGLAVVEMAAALGHERILKLLLDKEVPSDFANPRDGRTLLHTAAICNQSNAVALLIRRGAKVDRLDKNGFTPLHWASIQGFAEVAALLLQHKANPDSRTATPPDALHRPLMRSASLAGNTALHLAALAAHTNVIELLLKSGASVNATNLAGMTPLDFVAQPGLPFMGVMGPFSMIRRLNPGLEPLVSQRPTWQDPHELVLRRQAAASLLEKAGGKRGRPTRRPGVPPFGFP